MDSEFELWPSLASEPIETELDFRALNYPFTEGGRDASRLFFDFSVAAACLLREPPNMRILDFACGTGWTSEILNKLGYDVYGFDSDQQTIEVARNRIRLDARIDPKRLHLQVANGHEIPLPDQSFGHILCFDSLHHMADYEQVFREMHRLLCINGRAIFVEPGSRHSQSPETIRFLFESAKGEDWLEKDVNLDEIFALCHRTGFTELRIKPFLLPTTVEFSYVDWYHILDNPEGQYNYLHELRRSAWEDRVIFHMTRE